jgi:hypothetical protein
LEQRGHFPDKPAAVASVRRITDCCVDHRNVALPYRLEEARTGAYCIRNAGRSIQRRAGGRICFDEIDHEKRGARTKADPRSKPVAFVIRFEIGHRRPYPHTTMLLQQNHRPAELRSSRQTRPVRT